MLSRTLWGYNRIQYGDSNKDSEVVSCIERVAGDEGIQLAHIEGLGAADSVKVGLYDVDQKEFLCKEFHEPMEITALIGNITRQDGQPYR